MKTIKIVLLVAVVSLVAWSCKNETTPETKTVEVETAALVKHLDPNAKIAMAEFNIEGMTCAVGCAKTIEKKLGAMEGVKSATVDFDKKLAMVEYDEAVVTTTSLENLVTGVSEKYAVNGMKTVESFTSNGAKKSCEPGCKKACCTGKDKKECKKSKKECKKGDKANCAHKNQAHAGDKKACGEDCKKECCAKKA